MKLVQPKLLMLLPGLEPQPLPGLRPGQLSLPGPLTVILQGPELMWNRPSGHRPTHPGS
jgi:hypothetical protein